MNAENNESKHKIPKKKIPGKKIKFADHKKTIIGGGLVAAVAIAGLIGGFIIIGGIDEEEVVLKIGTYALPDWIDPLEAWWPHVHMDATCEGLFTINVSTENSEVIPNLASSFNWSDDSLNFTCTLRQGVRFHDGTPFDATAVKWNFDRINGLIDNLVYPYLWELPDGRPIVNETQVIDDHTVRFVLNAPFVPFKNLLSSWTAYILSPTATPANDFLDMNTEKLVGTGPFKYDSYNENVNMIITANPDYWGGKPKIDNLILKVFNLSFPLKALLSGEIDQVRGQFFNKTTINMLKDHPSFTVQEKDAPNLRSIVMNNKLINTTMRKAISYAVNYSAINQLTNEVTKQDVVRAKSPLPEAILYYNITGISTSYYNISIARQALIDASWPGTANLTANANISTGNEWEMIANSSNPLATYNYTWIQGFMPQFYENHTGIVLTENLKQIGVKVEPVGITHQEYFWHFQELFGYHRNMFELTFTYWVADYNDPNSFINPFYTNENIGQVNDTLVQQWMEEALEETDEAERALLYYKIQKRLIEEVYPYVWIQSSIFNNVHVSNLQDWTLNLYINDYKSAYLD